MTYTPDRVGSGQRSRASARKVKAMKWRQVLVCGLLLLAPIAGSDAEGRMTVEEVQGHLHKGMDRQQVEQFFEDHEIQYGFITREQSEEMAPRFQWKSEDAVGRYKGFIHDVRRRWWFFAREHVSIEVEVDSTGRVTQVVVKPAYTAP